MTTSIEEHDTAGALQACSDTVRLSEGWRFRRFETNATEEGQLQAEGVDDGQWEQVRLPHDWGIRGPFREELPNQTGKLPWHGVGWYRKSFVAPTLEPGERLLILFEGAMSHPGVWLNGQSIGEWAYGYNSFILDATAAARPGQENLLAVRLHNRLDSSRWYPGGGLYRDVWLLRKRAVAVEEWSTFIKTPKVSKTLAGLDISTTIRNGGVHSVEAVVRHVIRDPDGGEAAVVEAGSFELAAGAKLEVFAQAAIPDPLLWDIESPRLYTCRTQIRVKGTIVELHETDFGIRSIEWTAGDGFHLNGRRVPLQGVCQHHDLGALGAAFNLRAAERQLEILREMGCNAIRMAHNPPAPGLLDLCDRMGFLVVNELFDNWAVSKKPHDYGADFEQWHERDVRNWVCRDRNHPSVIAWSLGNEIREQEDLPGNHDRARRLVELTHRHDPTRPATVGMNEGESMLNGFAVIFDLAGYNYKAVLDKPVNYLTHLENNPGLPVMGAETSSCLSSRGVYCFPVSPDKSGGFFNFQVGSHDYHAPPWGYPPDVEFDSLDRFPAIAGEFVWSGFDYLGEPTPYSTDRTYLLNFSTAAEGERMLKDLQRLGKGAPSRSSYFGIIDLAGFPKDRFYLYQSRWRPELPMAHLLPHWNWHGREGEITPVHAYTSGDEAELFLNGRSLGRVQKGAGEYRLVWPHVRYQPGRLELVAYRYGVEWARACRETSGPPARLRVTADRTRILSDGRDLAFVTVEILDHSGRFVADACPTLEFEIDGPAIIAATDNGDPTDWTSFASSSRAAFNGLALAIVKGFPDRSGEARLCVSSPGLGAASLHITLRQP
jgi:beta-galactosidase